MATTLSAAVTLLESGPYSPFADGATTAQKKQRINQVINRFFTENAWRGNRAVLNSISSVSGVISLAAAYSAAIGISVPASNFKIDIKPMDWEFQSGSTGSLDWSAASVLVAIDMGDSSGGLRQYRLTGDPTYCDSLVLRILAKKRFVTLGDSDNIYPDNMEALRKGCKALDFEDRGDSERAKFEFSETIAMLNQDLEEFNAEMPQRVQVDPSLCAIVNIV